MPWEAGSELTKLQQLHSISSELIREEGVEALYQKIVDVAATTMDSDFASMQIFHPHRGSAGELQLIAFKGFNPDAAKFWEWVRADSGSSCGCALHSAKRVVVSDVATCDFMAGTEDQKVYLDTGIHVVQSTPLISRSGTMLGMLSTHWAKATDPSESDLWRLDLLARQAADLIERAHAQTKLQQNNAVLEQLVRERTAQLEVAMAEREKAQASLQQAQKMEAIGQLAGGIAHDFNNLLTVIRGNIEILETRLPTDHELQRLVGAALRGMSRAALLATRLLAFSRRQPLLPEVVSVNDLASGMEELLRSTLGETISIETVLADEIWLAFVDFHQLENVILNVALNARDAMPEGGKLVIETANCDLDDTYAALNGDVSPGQYVGVFVTDSGIGMSAEIIAQAFEPFYTTKKTGEGTGLGLSQVYGIVKQSGGHVKIYSEMGQGTTLKVYLPRCRVAMSEVAEYSQKESGDDEPAQAARRLAVLTNRERQVLDEIVAGQPNKVIAYKLAISMRTVEVHRARLLKRLGVRSVAEAISLYALASLASVAEGDERAP